VNLIDFLQTKMLISGSRRLWPPCACRLDAAERGFEAVAKVPTCENRADDSGCWKSASLRVELQAATGLTEQKADNWTDTSALFSAREIYIPVTKCCDHKPAAEQDLLRAEWVGMASPPTTSDRSTDRSRQSF